MKPCTKWADRVYNLKRIPEQVNCAFQKAMSGKPGPVYLDFPGDVLYAKIAEEQVDWSLSGRPLLNARPLGDPEKINALVDSIAQARQPIILSGSGVIWSKASQELQEFVEKTGIPFYTTPQGRGVVADDHEYSYLRCAITLRSWWWSASTEAKPLTPSATSPVVILAIRVSTRWLKRSAVMANTSNTRMKFARL
jgi:thiamine pyrophosphate-dependent acetolactate synthase large subunit-like protein